MKGLELGTLKIRACKWGRCNGTYVRGNPCTHCKTVWR